VQSARAGFLLRARDFAFRLHRHEKINVPGGAVELA